MNVHVFLFKNDSYIYERYYAIGIDFFNTFTTQVRFCFVTCSTGNTCQSALAGPPCWTMTATKTVSNLPLILNKKNHLYIILSWRPLHSLSKTVTILLRRQILQQLRLIFNILIINMIVLYLLVVVTCPYDTTFSGYIFSRLF